MYRVADFVCRTDVGKPSMPEVKKIITSSPTTATVILIYNNKVLDLQLDDIAKTGGKEA